MSGYKPKSEAAFRRLMLDFTAHELRKWTAANNISRQRGMSKAETADEALRQNPEAVLDYLGKESTEIIPITRDTSDTEIADMLNTRSERWIVLDITQGEHDIQYVRVGYF